MLIEVNETEYCKLHIKYETGREDIAAKEEEVIKSFRSRRIPGFRDGKATVAAVRIYFKKEIEQAISQQLAQDAAHNSLVEKNIKPFGMPKFTVINLENSVFRCEFDIHKQPDFELNKYKEFEIPKPSGVLPAEELSQKMLQDLRVRYGQTSPYSENDFVQMGDTIILDYKAFHNDKPIEQWTGTGQILHVGRINIPGFSENLLGMKMGESREFELKIPEASGEFSGELVKFEVKFSMGSKMEPAPLTDELAKSIGIESFDKLLENIKSTAASRVKELEKNQTVDQIAKRLIENHDFKIPDWVSTAEAQVNAKNAQKDWDLISDEDKTTLIDNADKSIKLSLVLQKVRENEPEAQLTDEETFAIAKDNIEKFSPNPQEVFNELIKNGHIGILFNRIRDEYTLDFIEKSCTFVE